MADEIVILVVRDQAGAAKDLAELIQGDIWAMRTHDPKLLPEIQAIKTNTDQLEGFTDGIEGLLTTIRDNADQVEALLTALGGNTDQVESLLITIRDNADQMEAFLTTIRDNADSVEAKLQDVIDGQALLRRASRETELLKAEIRTGEEFKREIVGAFTFHGAAVAADGGANVAASIWDIVRLENDASGDLARYRLRSGVRWDTKHTLNW